MLVMFMERRGVPAGRVRVFYAAGAAAFFAIILVPATVGVKPALIAIVLGVDRTSSGT